MGRASRLKRERRAQRNARTDRLLQVGINKLQSRLQDNGGRLRDRNGEPDKLSTAVLDIARPMGVHAAPAHEFKRLAGIAVLAWNLAVLLDAESLLRDNPELRAMTEDADLMSGLGPLIARKQGLYPDDRRFIVEYDVSLQDGLSCLTVASTRADCDA